MTCHNPTNIQAPKAAYSRIWGLALIALISFSPMRTSAAVDNNPASVLSTKYVSLTKALRNNPFQRPLVLESVESSNTLKGDVYAVVDYPFATVQTALQKPTSWCDVLILHLNTKYCKAHSDPKGARVKMVMGKKTPQALDDAYLVDLDYKLLRADQQYLGVKLDADEGPMGTRDYHIALEAIPIERTKTFIHFTYSYGYGTAGGLAMKAYLASKGSNKVGFTVTGQSGDASPKYIQGVRGMVERNTMRYYLAIDSYLGSLSTAPEKQVQKRLQDWFAATEKFPLQLREISRNAYMKMKADEIKRSVSVNLP